MHVIGSARIVFTGHHPRLRNMALTEQINLRIYAAMLHSRPLTTGPIGRIWRCNIAHKDNLTSERLQLDTDADIVAAKFCSKDSNPLIIISAYRHCNNDMDNANKLCDTIRKISTDYPDATIWIGGDFNLPDIDWTNLSIKSNRYLIALNELFIDCFNDTGLTQMVDFPTREHNTLDILLTNRPTLISSCSPAPGLSDHDMVNFTSSIQARRRKPVKRKISLWKKADLDLLNAELSDFTADFVSKNSASTDVNSLWVQFQTACLSALDKHVPSKMTSSRFSQPWINHRVKNISRRKSRAYARARKSKLPDDWNKYKELKKLMQDECRKAHKKYVMDVICDENNKNKFWKYIKDKRKDNSGVSPLNRDGKMHYDSSVKANILNDQFASVFSSEDKNNLPEMPPRTCEPMSDIDVTTHGVEILLSNLKPNKATGPDGVPARLLKESAKSIAPALSLIFQASLLQGKIPEQWREAYVSPLFKKGDRNLASNYRPISLTSIACKLLEHILYTNIMAHLDKNDTLSDFQHGFRKNRSCETQLLLTIHDLASGLNDRQQIDAILLDFSKAFDKVPHQRLLLKLEHYGISGHTLLWIKDFLTARTQRVILDGAQSQSADVVSGVPQGTVLGPLLFLVYINDLPERVSSTARLFADDCLLYRTISSENDSRLLQSDLNELQKWEDTWLMSFNPEKCEVLRITNKLKIIAATYSIHGQQLNVVNKSKYLGVTISSKLNWNDHVNNITKKANATRGFLQRNLRGAPAAAKCQAYQTFVRPTLEYASSVWDPHTQILKTKLESVQRKAARWVSNDWDRRSSVTTMVEKLQWQTLERRRMQSKMVMVYKIQHCLVAIPSVPPYFYRPTVATRGHNQQLWLPRHNIISFGYSFFPSIVITWNRLPQSLIDAPSMASFRNQLFNVAP